MNSNLLTVFEKQADDVVLNVILNGHTTISKNLVLQSLLETYEMGLKIGTQAIDPETVIPTLPAEPATATLN